MSSKKKKGCLGRLIGAIFACVIVLALILAGTNAWVIYSTQDNIIPQSEASEKLESFGTADAIVVLGASVLPDGTPSLILQDRLNTGIALYKAGVAPKIIMSGDNGTENYNEVKAMKEYALAQGVPSEDIFCDHAGFSTYESMYRAKHVFNVERMVVVTQTYHLYRALYAAQSLGINVQGVSSDAREFAQQLWFDAREVPARTKDFFQCLFNVPSQFVGDAISLNQSGDVTNG